jgi:uncharacterized RDD family membrane protein YckC
MSENLNEDVKYGGFFKRAIASIIDGILMSFVVFIFALLMFQLLGIKDGEMTPHSPAELLVMVVSILLISFIYAKFLVSSWQATPGKKLLNMKVVKALDFSKLSFKIAFMRFFVPSVILVIVPEVIIIFINVLGKSPAAGEGLFVVNGVFYIVTLIWYGMVIFSKEKRAGHDMILGTRVIITN